MTASHITPLRQMLEDIDARLLKLVTGPHPLAEADLQRQARIAALPIVAIAPDAVAGGDLARHVHQSLAYAAPSDAQETPRRAAAH